MIYLLHLQFAVDRRTQLSAVWTLLSLGVSQYSTFFKYLHDSAEQYYTHKSLEIAQENCIWAERTVEEHLI